MSMTEKVRGPRFSKKRTCNLLSQKQDTLFSFNEYERSQLMLLSVAFRWSLLVYGTTIETVKQRLSRAP